MSAVKAILFDVFGTVVDWRGSLIADFSAWGPVRFPAANWPGLVDAWRAAYAPSMNRVRNGELPWTNLDTLQNLSLTEIGPRFGLPAALRHEDRAYLLQGWHRLKSWPDAVPGLTRLKTRHIIAPLSNGNVALLVNMAKSASLPWDMVFATELFRHYKPDPETYLGAAGLLGLAPGDVMLAAAHNSDLAAARAVGLKTAFFPRPTEHGPHQTRDLAPESDWDVCATDIEDLASRMGA